ncbi:MAG: hypothetical protein WA939_09260 [Nodosilinea sp.]
MTKKILAKCLVLVVLILATACDRPSDNLFSRGQNNTVDIVIEQITETGQPGQFTLTGTTNLPDTTPLTVSAVRLIDSLNISDPKAEGSQHAILDRKSALVKDGRWQTQLQLWEIGSEGTYQENWQTIAGSAIDPASSSPSVDFLATLEPIDLAKSKLMARSDWLESANSPLLNFTPDGEPYLKVSQSRVVALPSGAVSATGLSQESQATWENRASRGSIDSPGITQIPFMDADNMVVPEENILR